ncbi:aminotransferase class IV [Marinifilum sp. D714]|uniref:aminotransferase class IV n=1 Tax=Marinifilum sp. D714 TaxID=2937523 RepID=UPI0027BC71F2|nr:aminotransferase class IV [Marinifilum sp. D714]MDQ2177555.1 aminotransferase class IV [Marinifilum sp. D714]
MSHNEYINLNGELFPKDSPVFGAENRAFRYGDSLFETIHSNGTEIQFFDQHLDRLIMGMKTIGMIVPENFRDKLKINITYLINKNKSFAGTRIRLSVFRNDGGLYTPTDNTVSYLIETSRLEEDQYVINKKGLKIDIYKDCRKSSDIISQFKTGNSLLFIMAGNYKNRMHLDDCLILNERGNPIESISSSLFIVKNDILMTPSIESGAVSGIMREQLIETALKLNMTVYDDCMITVNDLLEADEIFLSNAISGIRWVVAFRDRRYFNKTAKLLLEELNQNAFKY